jgi:hypothetical protein
VGEVEEIVAHAAECEGAAHAVEGAEGAGQREDGGVGRRDDGRQVERLVERVLGDLCGDGFGGLGGGFGAGGQPTDAIGDAVQAILGQAQKAVFVFPAVEADVG